MRLRILEQNFKNLSLLVIKDLQQGARTILDVAKRGRNGRNRLENDMSALVQNIFVLNRTISHHSLKHDEILEKELSKMVKVIEDAEVGKYHAYFDFTDKRHE